jgi:4-diphosphocytidyl-2-C-methyl-D-erythritol kinase
LKLEEKACAKVNLHLEVLNKRSDGYHSIFSLMASLALHDRVTLVDMNVKEGSDFHVDIMPDGGANEDVIRGMPSESNLVTKAVKEYFSGTGKACSASFGIEKNIPAGAGMGGGSSDAAAALRILNAMLGYHSRSELVQTGFRVGADVPFCLTGGTAICEGAGEIVTPLGVSLVGSVLVLNDGIQIDTGEAYRSLARPYGEASSATDIGNLGRERFRRAVADRRYDLLAGMVENDFEEMVFRKHPALAEIKRDLISMGPEIAIMTGSGSTIIGVFSDEAAARMAKRRFAGKIRQVILTTFEQNNLEA